MNATVPSTPQMIMRIIPAGMLLFFLAGMTGMNAYGKDTPSTTTGNPDIPIAELEWLLKPLTVDELEVEVNAWQDLLQQKVTEIAEANIALLEQKEEQKERAEEEGKVIAKGEPTDDEKKQKTSLLDQLTKLNEERTVLLDRTRLAVDAFEAKGGDEKKVTSYRKYLEVTSGVTVDVSDTEAVIAFAQGWLTSKEGGLRWLKNISVFVITVMVFYFLARVLSKAVRRAMDVTAATSQLMRNFLVTTVRRITMVVGVIVGLAALEVNIGPLLAVIGATGFVVAFALQDSLGNFASGLLIMIFRPFDVGDAVEVAGVAGKVEAVSLLSTQMKTFDNKAVAIPNNEVWGGVITNITATGQRRVDMQFGIGYDDDIDKAQKILEDIINSHELVLKDPEPVVRLHELGDSSVNFVVRPWAKTDDVWTVFWDVTREVKKRFDAESISIPFPQRDVHVYNTALPAAEAKSTAD